MTGRFLAATLAAFVFAAVLNRSDVVADTAIAATDSPSMTWGIAYNISRENEARAQAIERCSNEGGDDCRVIAFCGTSGYGSIAVKQVGPGRPVEFIGVSCGAASPAEAAATARRFCEYQVAKSFGSINTPPEHTTYELIKSELAQNCPGMGNCQCSERQAWHDTE